MVVGNQEYKKGSETLEHDRVNRKVPAVKTFIPSILFTEIGRERSK